MKDLAWLQSTKIEIQEQEEGKWIEIHLNETEGDNMEDQNEIVDEEDDWYLILIFYRDFWGFGASCGVPVCQQQLHNANQWDGHGLGHNGAGVPAAIKRR